MKAIYTITSYDEDENKSTIQSTDRSQAQKIATMQKWATINVSYS